MTRRRSASIPDRFRASGKILTHLIAVQGMQPRSLPTPTSSLSPRHPPSSFPSSSHPDKRLSLHSLAPSSSSKRGLVPSSSSFTDSEATSSHNPSNHRYTRSQGDQPFISTHQISTSQPHSQEVPSSRPSTARRPSSSASTRTVDPSKTLWSQKSVAKRITWGWNQTFAGLTPDDLTRVESHHAQRRIRDAPNRASQDNRASYCSTASADTTASTSSINKPFANRRHSSVTDARSARPTVELPPVTEESYEAHDQHPHPDEEAIIDDAQPDETDDMGLARAFTKRLQRSDSTASTWSFGKSKVPERKRPVISLPQLISTTNAQVTDPSAIHPALRAEWEAHHRASSAGSYNSSGGPGTPTSSGTPPLTSSGSSSRSSHSSYGNNSPFSEYAAASAGAGVLPNHLTQYFAAATLGSDVAFDKSGNSISVASAAPDGTVEELRVNEPPPAIPARAASHSKSEHVRLARSRSVRSSAGSTAPSVAEKDHNAAGALTQLAEVEEQEDFEKPAMRSRDSGFMNEHTGFQRCTPSVYMADLADMEATRFE